MHIKPCKKSTGVVTVHLHSGTLFRFLFRFIIMSLLQMSAARGQRLQNHFCIGILFIPSAQRAGSVVICFPFCVIGFDDSSFQCRTELNVDRMDNITVRTVGVFSARHNDNELVSCINDLDIVNCQCMVKGDGDNGFHRSLVKKFSDFDVGNVHVAASFRCV